MGNPFSFKDRTQVLSLQYNDHRVQLVTLLKQKRSESSDSVAKIEKIIKRLSYDAEYLRLRIEDNPMVEKFITYLSDEANFTTFSRSFGDQEAVITKQVQSDYDDLFFIFRSHPDLIIDLAHLFPNPDKSICDLLDRNELWDPSPELIENAYLQKDKGLVVDIKYRYLVNMSSTRLIQYLGRNEVHPNVITNAKMFLKLSHQSRWSDIWKQVLVSMFYYDSESQKRSLGPLKFRGLSSMRRTAKDLVTLQTIAYILKKFDNLPFFVTQNNSLRLNSITKVWGVSLIPLIFSLLELSKEERGCNIHGNYTISAIQYRITAAFTSFETEMLESKGTYGSLMKMVTHSLSSHSRLTWDPSFQSAVITNYGAGTEITATKDEKTNLTTLLQDTNELFRRTFLHDLQVMKKYEPTCITRRARYLLSLLTIYPNPGIYFKTALSLEAVKSIEGKIEHIINFPKPSERFEYYDFFLDIKREWTSGDPIWGYIRERFEEIVNDSVNSVFDKNLNMENKFASLLTNNSQGLRIDTSSFSKELNLPEELAQTIGSVGQVRIASFLLRNDIFRIPKLFLDTLTQDAACTTRFQNFRRSRIVEIVPNVDQTAYALILLIFEDIKPKYDDMAVGKQRGGIGDMKLQLHATSSPYNISIFSDVKGMDTSTQPSVGIMFPSMVAEIINQRELGPDKYFIFSSGEYTVHSTVDPFVQFVSDKPITPVVPTKKQKLQALALALNLVTSQRSNKPYRLKDPIFGVNLKINPVIFESGRFDTTFQHTMLLKILGDKVYADFKMLHPQLDSMFFAQRRRFGDDAIDVLVCQPGIDIQLVTDLVVELTNKILAQCGFKTETEVSSFYADFLQQMAFCGIQVPKSARSSIFTDERGSLRNRDPIDSISNLINVIMAAAQRCHAASNVISIIRPMWNVLRYFRLVGVNPAKISGSSWAPFLVGSRNRFYFRYPYLLINLPPINFWAQMTEVGPDLYLKARAPLKTVGDCGYLWLWDSLFTAQEKRDILAFVDDGTELVKTFFNRTKDTVIRQCLILGGFIRSQMLSKKRNKELEVPLKAMADASREYYDKNKLQKSLLATHALRETYGITLPDSLCFYMKPTEQIMDMFASVLESAEEAEHLNREYISYILKHSDKNPKKIEKAIIATSVFFFETSEPVERHAQSYPELPIVPCYYSGSCYGNALTTHGLTLSSDEISKAVLTFQARHKSAFNLNIVMQYGLQIRSLAVPAAMELFFEALSLPSGVEADIRDLINAQSFHMLTDTYKSGFQPEQLFLVSGDKVFSSTFLHQFRGKPTNENPQGRMSQVGTTTGELMFRDYLLMNSHRTHPYKYEFLWSDASFNLIEQASILRNKGTKAV